MFNRLQGRRWFVAWFVILGAAGAIYFGSSTFLRPQRWLAARVAAQLDSVPTTELAQHMRQLAAFGEEGMPHLVSALKDERPQVAAEARLVLSEELDQWQVLPARDASRRLALLASELARGIEGCSPTTRRLASDLATRVLLWPVDASAIDQQQLIGDCERVLVAVRGGEAPTVLPAQLAMSGTSPRNPSGELSPLDDHLMIPGGGLPIEMERAPSLPPEERSQPRAFPQDDPKLVPVLPRGEEPRTFIPEVQPLRPGTVDRGASTTLTSIYKLVSNDADERDQAEASLRESGFGEVHLAVARRFADSRPHVRRELVAQLTRQTVVEARPWLLRLLEDEDASVRSAAANILVTSSDPQTLRYLRDREVLEADPNVRAILAKAVSE